jgi:hypothetical protein
LYRSVDSSRASSSRPASQSAGSSMYACVTASAASASGGALGHCDHDSVHLRSASRCRSNSRRGALGSSSSAHTSAALIPWRTSAAAWPTSPYGAGQRRMTVSSSISLNRGGSGLSR